MDTIGESFIKEQLKQLFLTRVEEAKATAKQIYATPCRDLAEVKERLNIISLLIGSLLGQLEMLLQINVTEEEIGVNADDVKAIFTP